jgi:CTP:molybdopterin cytidylyltransferase MocA
MIVGIVLAAGLSRRMGEPKAFLRAGEGSFLDRVVHALGAACDRVIVVTGPNDQPAARDIAEAATRLGASVAINPDRGSPQLRSLQAGLAAVPPEARAVIACPVDIPDVSPSLALQLARVFSDSGAPVVLPSHGGKHGHPVLFARSVFTELARTDLPEGARSVVHAHRGELREVPVDVLPADVDTPEDYRRWREAACPSG